MHLDREQVNLVQYRVGDELGFIIFFYEKYFSQLKLDLVQHNE